MVVSEGNLKALKGSAMAAITLDDLKAYFRNNKSKSTRFAVDFRVPFESGTDDVWASARDSKEKIESILETNIHAAAVDTLAYHDVNDDGWISYEELKAS